MNDFAGVDHPQPGDRGWEIDRRLEREAAVSRDDFAAWTVEVDELEPDRRRASINSELNVRP